MDIATAVVIELPCLIIVCCWIIQYRISTTKPAKGSNHHHTRRYKYKTYVVVVFSNFEEKKPKEAEKQVIKKGQISFFSTEPSTLPTVKRHEN